MEEKHRARCNTTNTTNYKLHFTHAASLKNIKIGKKGMD
jgi:hypothetical protein